MPTKVFNFVEDGLSYSITLTQEPDGTITATITVHSGHMDVNAIYFADDDQTTGGGANLQGPQNMNGAGSQYEGERIDWDGVADISRPGLGREGTSKASYLDSEGPNSLSITLPGVNSLDDIDYIGVRATSTSTPEGSIKGVSREEDDGNGGEDCDLPEGTNKLQFMFSDGEGGEIAYTMLGSDEALAGINNPTLQDYYDALLPKISGDPQYDIKNLIRIDAYNVVGEGDDQTVRFLGSYDPGDDFDPDAPLPETCFDETTIESYDDEDENEPALVF